MKLTKEELKEKKYINAGEINQDIEELEKLQPDGRTKEYNEWEEKINYLYGIYNKMINFAAYKIIK